MSASNVQSSLEPSFLKTRRGKLTLALMCAAGFLDFVDTTIVNVALPSIRHGLHFSVQNLQWVLSGYLLTYGGLLLLGGRAADLLGRRRLLVAGTTLFALSSLAGGLADSDAVLIAARLAQGLGAAMMTPPPCRSSRRRSPMAVTGSKRWVYGARRCRWPRPWASRSEGSCRKGPVGVRCSSSMCPSRCS